MALEKNVLVVDDETMIRESVSAYITKQGYHVFAAEDGKEALDVFQKHPIMFVILDLMLPGISGEEVCPAIRRQSVMPFFFSVPAGNLCIGLYRKVRPIRLLRHTNMLPTII